MCFLNEGVVDVKDEKPADEELDFKPSVWLVSQCNIRESCMLWLVNSYGW